MNRTPKRLNKETISRAQALAAGWLSSSSRCSPSFVWLPDNRRAEFAGSLALVVSPFSGVAAFGVARVTAITMTDALMHCQQGFFNEPGGVRTGEGTEYHLLAAGLA
jgi:hypothetical protein